MTSEIEQYMDHAHPENYPLKVVQEGADPSEDDTLSARYDAALSTYRALMEEYDAALERADRAVRAADEAGRRLDELEAEGLRKMFQRWTPR